MTMNIRTLATLAAALALAACSALKPAEKPGDGKPGPSSAPDEVASPRADVPTVRLITAQTPAVRAYRKTGARQIYNAYPQRIYKGKIPPLVYACLLYTSPSPRD